MPLTARALKLEKERFENFQKDMANSGAHYSKEHKAKVCTCIRSLSIVILQLHKLLRDSTHNKDPEEHIFSNCDMVALIGALL